jgi:hypothetical protein
MAEAVQTTGPQSTVVLTEELVHVQMEAPSTHHTRHAMTHLTTKPYEYIGPPWTLARGLPAEVYRRRLVHNTQHGVHTQQPTCMPLACGPSLLPIFSTTSSSVMSRMSWQRLQEGELHGRSGAQHRASVDCRQD